MRITILANAEPGADESFGLTVGQVAAGLRKGSHRVSVLGVHNEIGRLISGLKRRQPDLVFQLMDPEPADGPRPVAIVGLLDLLGLPYTGSCPGESYIQDDPGIARKLLGLNGEAGANGHHHDVEEFRVGVIGNDELSAFEPVSSLDPELPNLRFPHNRLRQTACDGVAPACGERLRQDLTDAALAAYRALRVRDYGTIDLRVVDGREVEPVGVRTDCNLGESGELARSAAAAGLSYASLVNHIAESAMARAEQQQLVRLI